LVLVSCTIIGFSTSILELLTSFDEDVDVKEWDTVLFGFTAIFFSFSRIVYKFIIVNYLLFIVILFLYYLYYKLNIYLYSRFDLRPILFSM